MSNTPTNITQFDGIRNFHDGISISDYTNMIPLEHSVIDRWGEVLLDKQNGDFLRGWFCDSMGTIYTIVNDGYVRYYNYDVQTHVLTYNGKLLARNGTVFQTLNPDSRCTFCESSTKPSQIYLCDGKYVYWWNTSDNSSDNIPDWLKTAYTVNMLISPKAEPIYKRQTVSTISKLTNTVTSLQASWAELSSKLSTIKSINTLYHASNSRVTYSSGIVVGKTLDNTGAITYPHGEDIYNSLVKDVNTGVVDYFNDLRSSILPSDKYELSNNTETVAALLSNNLSYSLDVPFEEYSGSSSNELVSLCVSQFQAYLATWKTDTRIGYEIDGNYVVASVISYQITNIAKTKSIPYVEIKVKTNYSVSTWTHYVTYYVVPALTITAIDTSIYTQYSSSGSDELLEETQQSLKSIQEQLTAAQSELYTQSKRETSYDAMESRQNTLDLYDYITNPSSYSSITSWGYDLTNIAVLTEILWYDNRVYALEEEYSTVWGTATDPGQFTQMSDAVELSDDYGTFWHTDNPIFTINDSDTTTVENEVTAQNNLWSYWISSTNESDKLLHIATYQGDFYMLNRNSIEVWSFTGSEDNPLISSYKNTIHMGCKCAVALRNLFVLITTDDLNRPSIKVLNSSELTTVSNTAIDALLSENSEFIFPFTVGHLMCIGIGAAKTALSSELDVKTPIYCFTPQYKWFKWVNDNTHDGAIASVVADLGITNRGSLVRFVNTSRTLYDGTPIFRSITDWFITLPHRVVIRSFELVCDTGRKLSTNNPDNAVTCTVSFDRALRWSPRRFRYLSDYNNDHVLIWRNLGSGNSFMFQIATAADYVLQIYMVSIYVA